MTNTRFNASKETTNIGKKLLGVVYFLVTLVLGHSLALQAQANDHLDLGQSSQWIYSGTAQETYDNAVCRLKFSRLERDFSGKFFQDITIEVDPKGNKPGTKVIVKIRPLFRHLAPDSYTNSNRVAVYSLPAEGLTQPLNKGMITLTAPVNDPLSISSVYVSQTGSANKILPVVDCEALQKKAK